MPQKQPITPINPPKDAQVVNPNCQFTEYRRNRVSLYTETGLSCSATGRLRPTTLCLGGVAKRCRLIVAARSGDGSVALCHQALLNLPPRYRLFATEHDAKKGYNILARGILEFRR